ncbi:MAG: reverse transcriptase-like protein [Lachnospiraceae bacterium]|nr:reverse transcriptase-like protein [Lachnospiraceae bacterium]
MNEITVYVDGSYNDALKKYAFGCVFLSPEGVRCACGSGNNPDSLKSRNVTGEMLGAMYAVQCARKSGYDAIHIYYDYSGIEDWVTGAWKTKNDLTKKYAAAMRGWGQEITLHFHKVVAHTNVTYNELADEMAKKGLETDGIPAIRPVSEIEIHEA